MATIVVGGHSRNIGKTSLIAGLISALARRRWTAVKITQHGHGVCQRDGRECCCGGADHAYSIVEELRRDESTDSSRYLAAGAARSVWVRVKQGKLALAVPELLANFGSDTDVIIESNSILRFIRPHVYLFVLHADTPDFKNSARDFLHLADAAVVINGRTHNAAWKGVDRRALQGLRSFQASPAEITPPDLVRFVSARLRRGIEGHGFTRMSCM